MHIDEIKKIGSTKIFVGFLVLGPDKLAASVPFRKRILCWGTEGLGGGGRKKSKQIEIE